MRALARRGVRILYDVVREPEAPPGSRVRTAHDIVRLFQQRQEAGHLPRHREAFVAFLLNTRHEVIAMETVSVGTLQSSSVHPREVFRAAICAPAAALVVAHNHPSGDASPSPDDRNVTERLREAGELLGIELLDHVVIGAERFYSFASESYEPIERPAA